MHKSFLVMIIFCVGIFSKLLCFPITKTLFDIYEQFNSSGDCLYLKSNIYEFINNILGNVT